MASLFHRVLKEVNFKFFLKSVGSEKSSLKTLFRTKMYPHTLLANLMKPRDRLQELI